jgi:hypothetical protein
MSAVENTLLGRGVRAPAVPPSLRSFRLRWAATPGQDAGTRRRTRWRGRESRFPLGNGAPAVPVPNRVRRPTFTPCHVSDFSPQTSAFPVNPVPVPNRVRRPTVPRIPIILLILSKAPASEPPLPRSSSCEQTGAFGGHVSGRESAPEAGCLRAGSPAFAGRLRRGKARSQSSASPCLSLKPFTHHPRNPVPLGAPKRMGEGGSAVRNLSRAAGGPGSAGRLPPSLRSYGGHDGAARPVAVRLGSAPYPRYPRNPRLNSVLSGFGFAGGMEAELNQFGFHRDAGDAEPAGGLGLVALGLLNGAREQLPFRGLKDARIGIG